MSSEELNELQEHAEHARHNPSLAPVTLTMAILAVLVAALSLLGHRAHTEQLLLQTKATDQAESRPDQRRPGAAACASMYSRTYSRNKASSLCARGAGVAAILFPLISLTEITPRLVEEIRTSSAV